jgi:RHS repeat-associated protein
VRIDYASSSASSAIDAIGNRSATSTSAGGFGWSLPDLHGNVAGILGSSGSALSDAFRYDAYGRTIGKTTSSLPTPWRFQGRLQLSTDDGSGNSADLYDFGARAYDPSLGVFTSFDTMAGGAQNPLTLNRFLYAAANPATLIDPDGHFFTGMSLDASDSGLGTIGARYVSTEVRNRTVHRNYVRRLRITNAGAVSHRNQFLAGEGIRDTNQAVKLDVVKKISGNSTPNDQDVRVGATRPIVVAKATDSAGTGPLPSEVWSGGCVSVGAEAGLMGAAGLCLVSGWHLQVQVQVGASTGVGVSAYGGPIFSNAPTGTQLSGFGGGYGGTVGGGLLLGSDRSFSQWNGNIYTSSTVTGGIGIEVSPEFTVPIPGEAHSFGSFTFDINDFVGAAWNWLTGR